MDSGDNTPARHQETIRRRLVDATGTVRRLRALVAIGYSQTDLALRLGLSPVDLSALINAKRKRVPERTFSSTCLIFASLWDIPVLDPAGERLRRIAKARKWAVPLAWDDIDDPAETPNVRGVKSHDLDEIAIELATRGERVRLTPAERRVAVAQLHSRRWSDMRIAVTLHITDRTVLRIRQELDLQAFDFGLLRQANAA
ncbi:hypothetical protein [Cryobacterium zhongshanensis]|uniref:Uncharacterized protein n=1 Tax=Cryobacterium zhongshanensis TaxID=2928153 RepID=A0AA41QWU5_9MICO|nr:hypothetical protein [Cryobacterium zhongshanensis]MCI4659620.1 hypothetical protein [Cryobacterium zhongshanensis]